MLNKDKNLAFDALQNVLKIDPKSRDARNAVSRYYAVQKDYAKAAEQLRGILADNPNDLEVRAELGDLYAATGDFKQAENEYSDIKRRAPKIPLGYVKLAQLYMSRGKAAAAVPLMEQAVKLNPRSPSCFHHSCSYTQAWGSTGRQSHSATRSWARTPGMLSPLR